MLHEPAQKSGKDPASGFKTRLGVWMFFLYAIVYGSFVAINVIKPVLMEMDVVFGLNLAVVYGFGLIIFAILLALIYNMICTRKERELNALDSDIKSKGEDA